MKHIIRILVFVFLSVASAQAQPQRIDNFIVKENLTQNSKLAIIALDSAEQPLERIDGTFVFNLNGFQQDLRFHDGVAVVQQPVESSTFVFFKHKNQEKTVSKLYYIHKKNSELKPFKINGLLLLFIPLAILLIAYLFRRFLVTFVVLAVVYAYFHFSKGLDFSNIMESILDALKSLI
ncbi:hypothetical protein FXV77_18490 [Sphingobacterium phlebotomi]|uniref:Uncharacterized protein n=1 Tax=Sphingobacterium phlebotomi TaxID=2605433 RepID=A0A5D4H0I3_9SPHI|nr:hypothetical protein [Sphingobacterium phlebotomi]TYR33025.1 hypothetical protein FXV77_18490 [Sphingobacterium phlebotomi]